MAVLAVASSGLLAIPPRHAFPACFFPAVYRHSAPPPPSTQVCIVPVSEKFIDYANAVRDRIHGAG